MQESNQRKGNMSIAAGAVVVVIIAAIAVYGLSLSGESDNELQSISLPFGLRLTFPEGCGPAIAQVSEETDTTYAAYLFQATSPEAIYSLTAYQDAIDEGEDSLYNADYFYATSTMFYGEENILDACLIETEQVDIFRTAARIEDDEWFVCVSYEFVWNRSVVSINYAYPGTELDAEHIARADTYALSISLE